MKNVLSLTPGSISIISDKRELAGMGEIRMEEKRHSFFVKNTNLFVGVDFIYKHTHTHTHTHVLRSLYTYIYANQESGLYTDTVRYLAYSMRGKIDCGCFSLLSGRGEQPFGVSNGVLSYSIDVL